jgi:hypothetical protein
VLDPNDLVTISGYEPLTYISPLFVDGSPTTLKEYERVRIVFKGIFKLTVMYDNDEVVIEKQFMSKSLTKFDKQELRIPNENDKAFSIRFKIEGRGIVKSLQYTYTLRDAT